jgi:hypothetical protein
MHTVFLSETSKDEPQLDRLFFDARTTLESILRKYGVKL